MSVQAPEHRYDPLTDEGRRRGKGLSTGAIIGIVVSALFHIGLVYYLWKSHFTQHITTQDDKAIQVEGAASASAAPSAAPSAAAADRAVSAADRAEDHPAARRPASAATPAAAARKGAGQGAAGSACARSSDAQSTRDRSAAAARSAPGADGRRLHQQARRR